MSRDEFINACKQVGLNVTYQRIAIFNKLMEHTDHPSADDIYKEVQQDYPTISLATVYKTLETLAEHDLISKVTYLHDIARYDGTSEAHHHLVCIKCKKIIDIDSNALDAIGIPADIPGNFRILNYRVQFDGICESCESASTDQ